MRTKVLSGSGLKVIAVVAMVCDHLSKTCMRSFAFARRPLFYVLDIKVDILYLMSSGMGRMAFPIFAFLLVEGYRHTHDVRKYALNLALFAVLSVVPFSLAFYGVPVSFGKQNIFFTLLLGLLAIVAMDRWRGWKRVAAVGVLLAIAFLGCVDYGILGVCSIILLYALRDQRNMQPLAVIASLFRGKTTTGVFLAAAPLLMYNGERGFIHGRFWKYCFYAFYPVHLLVIYLLGCA